MTRVLVMGAAGQLGSALKALPWGDDIELHCTTRAEVDLQHSDQIKTTIAAIDPQVIINASAYTAVDKAESERELSRAINVHAVAAMAEAAKAADAWLLHFSTDYVYDGSGDSPLRESEPTRPINAYGRDKLAGEEAIVEAGAKALILRTSWVYSATHPCFLASILRLARERTELRIVDDQWGAPSYNVDLARACQSIVQTLMRSDSSHPAHTGAHIYHLCGAGETTWFRFCKAILSRAWASESLNAELRTELSNVLAITTAEFPLPANRPLNSRLEQSKIQGDFGLIMPAWEEALDRCFAELQG